MNDCSKKSREGSSKRRSETPEAPRPKTSTACETRPNVEASRTSRKRRHRFVL
jgi:hypothetical protein